MNKKQKKLLRRIVVSLVLFVVFLILSETQLLRSWVGSPADLYVEFALFLIPYLIAGYDVLLKAAKNIGRGQVFDENFLMSVATLGAFALVFFPGSDPHMSEGAAVMIFFQIGELFESIAVSRTRKSIAQMMDIAPEYANVVRDGDVVRVSPDDVKPGDEFVVKPGERVALDGVVVSGSSQVDTAALTGESVPRRLAAGDEIVSGSVNMTGALTVRATKPYADSTVSRILELVESASERKARTESFITRFARWYTPVVVGIAVLLAVVAPLVFAQPWADWIERGLIFLVVSCPCALVISVPLAFFGGIGGASRQGILVKGGNYLEALAQVSTVVFDKTGTLTSGTFDVVEIVPAEGVSANELLDIATVAESFSDHPIAASIRAAGAAAGVGANAERAQQALERPGFGVSVIVDGRRVLVGNAKLMAEAQVACECREDGRTVVYVACDEVLIGSIVIADVPKQGARQAIEDLRKAGVERTVMLTGDYEDVAACVARDVGVDEFHAHLLPQQKVEWVERIMAERPKDTMTKTVAFVGDGINDAPVLMRADVGIAMGALGSDAAIEAADVVLMDDDPTRIALAMRIARKTLGIVWQNIVFALGVKFAVLVLAAFGIANMWFAVFADVGVAVLAIVNSMRCMRVR